MKKEHKLRRINDQVFCEECGRQWDLDDVDQSVTSCQRESQAAREAVESMRKMFCKKPLQGKQ